MEAQERKNLKDKKRIVIKIGSSSLTHPETGELNLMKIEKLYLFFVIFTPEGSVSQVHFVFRADGEQCK